MRVLYFSLLYFILTAFIFIQSISIYGESDQQQMDLYTLIKDKFKSFSMSGETIPPTGNPNPKLIINQQNNIGFEACTGSGTTFTCTIQEGETLTFTWECFHDDDTILVQCNAANVPTGATFDPGTAGNPTTATFKWENAGPPGTYTLGPISAICINAACSPDPAPDTITIIVNGSSTSKDEFIKRAFEKICQDPNTDFSTLSKQELINLNKVISARYAALYFEKPEAFKWAGMASYASGLVGWGLWGSEQIHTLNKKTPAAEVLFNSLREGNTELYRDIGWQHEAFISEGITALERIHNQGGLPDKQFKSWQKIDEGLRTNNAQLIREGNKDLLEFEQTEFLQNKVYEPNREFWESYTKNDKLPLFSPIDPWYAPDDFRHYINNNHPGVDPNIGDPEQRWNWVSESMLPRYQLIESIRPLHDVVLRDHLNLGAELCPNVKPQL
jgi:hypothetical protein